MLHTMSSGVQKQSLPTLVDSVGVWVLVSVERTLGGRDPEFVFFGVGPNLG